MLELVTIFRGHAWHWPDLYCDRITRKDACVQRSGDVILANQSPRIGLMLRFYR
jgi:hypothetical protein